MGALSNFIGQKISQLVEKSVNISHEHAAKQRRDWEASNRPVYSPPKPQDPRPGWMLSLRSPFEPTRPVTSWIGGSPRVPVDFEWPRDSNGQPLMFVAQIDLADVTPEPETGKRPAGLAETGAIVAFFPLWGEAPQVIKLSAEDMVDAVTRQNPDDLADVTEFGFWTPRNTPKCGFAYWPVDLIPYFHTKNDAPVDAAPWPNRSPLEWAQTNAMAALDLENLAQSLRNNIRLSGEFLERHAEPQPKEPKHLPRNRAQCQTIAAHGPTLLKDVESLLAFIATQSPEAVPDNDAYASLYDARKEFTYALEGSAKEGYHPLHFAALGEPGNAWNKLTNDHPYLHDFDAAPKLPVAFQTFAAQMITAWHGHYLYGHSQFCADGEPTAQNALLYLRADRLLGNQSEHEDGFSICYPEGSNPADHKGTHFVFDRHTNV